MRRLAVVACLLASSFLPATALAAGWQPLLPSPAGVIVLPVTIDGQGPFRFLLDTGSSRTAISRALADRLGLRSVAEARVLTPGGEATRGVTHLRRLIVDNMTAVETLATIVPGAVFNQDANVDGLVGQDVLSRLRVTIDYRGRRLMWSVPSETDAGIRLPLEWAGGSLLVPAAGLRLIPDSGADGIVLFARPGRPMPSATPLGTGTMRTVSGVRVTRQFLVDELSLGDFVLRDQIASLVTGSGLATSADGLLPLHLFAQVTIDGPGRMLIIVPR
jgi:hypothetical protein